jgi:rRNA maturation protein Nop10
MAAKKPHHVQLVESCPGCGEDTEHQVRLQIMEENNGSDDKSRSFSREPYRVSECSVCGETETIRMNNA